MPQSTISPQANTRLSLILNHPSFNHSFLSVQYCFDGGCVVTYYTADTNEHRCCFEIFADGTLSPLLIHDRVVDFYQQFPAIQFSDNTIVDQLPASC